MKNILQISILTSLLLIGVNSFSQTNNFCGSDVMRKELIEKHPEILQWEQELEDFTTQFSLMSGQRSGPYIIPVVFHVIHRGGSENISDAQVFDQMRILNEDFNKQNADLADVIPSFQSIIGDMEVEFRLAAKDPDGNCTNGIEHIWGSQTYLGNDYCKLNGWPRDKYLNIWVYSKMRPGVAGYAYYPSGVPAVGELPMIDGINILSNYIGSIGSSNYGRARALTHEIGHSFNLAHCWGSNNQPGVACGDDHVFDTPETKGWDHCPSPANAAICNPPVIENYQNFMEYAYCENMFTEGQKTRMLAALNSTTAERSNLWSAANLTETGTDQSVPASCAPICDFSSNKLFACVGDPVVYSDDSYNGDVTSRLWLFPGGDIADSYDPSPVVTYNTQGVYPVTLDVLNANGNASKTQSLVTVKDTNNILAPYYTDFEDVNEFDYWWSCINTDRDNAKFQYCNTAGRNHSKSVLLSTYLNRADMNIDELISPPFDCSALNNTTARLSFYYSFATWNSRFSFYDPDFNLPDSMIILASKDCSPNWVKIYANGKNDLFNAAFQEGYFTPGTDQIYWKKLDIAIPTTFRTRGVRFRIVVLSSHEANNFYLDDWNIGLSPTGIEEEAFGNVNLMPNPFTSKVYLGNLPNEQVSYEVRDITGRVLSSEPLQQNANAAEIDLSGISSSGVYLLTLKQKTSSKTYRLLKQ